MSQPYTIRRTVHPKPYLNIQRRSFYDFLNRGLNIEFSAYETLHWPKSGIELTFHHEHYRLVQPTRTVRQCILKRKDYSASLFMPIELHYRAVAVGTAWFKLMDLPLMTKNGHFIINGIARVVLNQVVRSPGVHFQETRKPNGTLVFNADFIAHRGTWLRLEAHQKEKSVWAKLKNCPKLPLIPFLRCFGLRPKILNTYLDCLQNSDWDVPQPSSIQKNNLQNVRKNVLLDEVLYDGLQDKFKNDRHRSPNQWLRPTARKAFRPSRAGKHATHPYAKASLSVAILDRGSAPDQRIGTRTNATANVRANRRHVELIYGRFLKRRFWNRASYDLSSVGRWRLNRTLGLRIARQQTHLTATDVLFGAFYLLQCSSGSQRLSDMDDLQNRHVKSVCTLLQNQLAAGLFQFEKLTTQALFGLDAAVDNRSQTKSRPVGSKSRPVGSKPKPVGSKPNQWAVWAASLNEFRTYPSYLATVKPRTKPYAFEHYALRRERAMFALSRRLNIQEINQSFRSFFGTNPLSQLLDETNALAELTHKRRLSSLGLGGITRDTATMAVRGIHPTHYGRICPIETPEGQNAGLVNSLTGYGQLNDQGLIETPLFRSYKGYVLDGGYPLAFAPGQEANRRIASADLSHTAYGFLANRKVAALVHVDYKKLPREAVDLTAVTPAQMISVATGLIPFLEHDDGNRALMGSNMQRQAIPTLHAARPIVGTGNESRTVADVGTGLQVKHAGLVAYVDGQKIVLVQGHDQAWPEPRLPSRATIKLPGLLPTKPRRRKRKPRVLKAYNRRLKSISTGENYALFVVTLRKKPNSWFRSVQPRIKRTTAGVSEGTQKRGLNTTVKYAVPSLKPAIGVVTGLTRTTPLPKYVVDPWTNDATFANGLATADRSPAARPTTVVERADAPRNLSRTGRMTTTEPSFVHVTRLTAYWLANATARGLRRVDRVSRLKPVATVKKTTHTRTYHLQPLTRSNQETYRMQRPAVHPGQWVQAGDMVAENVSSRQGEVSVGQNLFVGYLPWDGYNFEDAVLINRRLVSDDVLTSLHVLRYEIHATDTPYGFETLTKALPPSHDHPSWQRLDEDGVVRVGSWVKAGDTLVGRITPIKPRPLSAYERLLFSLLEQRYLAIRETSLVLPQGAGRVVHVEKVTRAQERRVKANGSRKKIKAAIRKEGRERNRLYRERLRIQASNQRQPVRKPQVNSDAVSGLSSSSNPSSAGANPNPRSSVAQSFLQSQLQVNLGQLKLRQSKLQRQSRYVFGLSRVTGNEFGQVRRRPRPARVRRFAFGRYPTPQDKPSSLHIWPDGSYTNYPNRRTPFESLSTRVRRRKRAYARAYVYIAHERKIQVGDKLSGRHGNKGIISRILPVESMPYLPDGTPLDVVLNPLGVPSRMNVGQIFECLLGLAGAYLNQNYKLQSFDEVYGSEASRSLVYSKLYEARLKTRQNWLFDPNFPGKVRLFDGRSGQTFEQPVTVGKAYILKLIHQVEEKMHARSTGPYSLVTQQPLRGRSKNGGQRLGEMEVWALEGFGASYTLQEMMTFKSDDMPGRRQLLDSIRQSSPMVYGVPESFRVMMRELQGLCLELDVVGLDQQFRYGSEVTLAYWSEL